MHRPSLVLLFGMCATNMSLQSVVLSRLNQANVPDALLSEIAELKKLITISVILYALTVAMLVAAGVLLYLGRNIELSYLFLVLSGALLLVGGGLGANVAIRLQCYKHLPDPAVPGALAGTQLYDAWQYASWSAAIGILGTILLLAMQAFKRRSGLKQLLVDQLVGKARELKADNPFQGVNLDKVGGGTYRGLPGTRPKMG